MSKGRLFTRVEFKTKPANVKRVLHLEPTDKYDTRVAFGTDRQMGHACPIWNRPTNVERVRHFEPTGKYETRFALEPTDKNRTRAAFGADRQMSNALDIYNSL
jgi:hypothetical protein